MKQPLLFLWAIAGLIFLQSCSSKDVSSSASEFGMISGIVVDTNGVSIANVVVSSTPPSSQVLTVPDGSYLLPNLEPGVYTVRAEKTGVGSGEAAVNVIAGKTTTANIVLTSGPITTGNLAGQVLDASSAIVAGAQISTIPASTTTISDATGHFTVTGIPAGTYSVVAKKNGFLDGSKNAIVTAGQTAIVTIQLGIAGALPTDGLLAYYRLDGDGTDASGNNRTLLITNGLFVSSRSATAQALSFASGAQATASHDVTLNPASITVSLWIKAPPPSVASNVFSKYAGPSTFNGYTLWYTGSGNIEWLYGQNTGNFVFAVIDQTSVTDNAWHSIICTTDATGCRMFFDGVIAASGTWQGSPGAPTHSKDLQLGDDNGNYRGVIDDVRIYNRVLTSQEIDDLANEQ